MPYMPLIAMVFDIALSVSLGTLFGYHMYCTTHALTTLEFDSFPKGNPFDMGYFANFKLIMGTNWWAWMIPIPPTGQGSEGIEYPMSKADPDDESETFL